MRTLHAVLERSGDSSRNGASDVVNGLRRRAGFIGDVGGGRALLNQGRQRIERCCSKVMLHGAKLLAATSHSCIE